MNRQKVNYTFPSGKPQPTYRINTLPSQPIDHLADIRLKPVDKSEDKPKYTTPSGKPLPSQPIDHFADIRPVPPEKS